MLYMPGPYICYVCQGHKFVVYARAIYVIYARAINMLCMPGPYMLCMPGP